MIYSILFFVKGGDILFFKSIKNEHVDYQCLDEIGHQTKDLYLCYCGIEFCHSDHFYGPIIRSEYLIHFILKGRGFYTILGNTYELHPNQAFLIPPGIETTYHAVPDDPYSYIWVAFDGEKATSYLAQTALSVESPVCDLHLPVEEFRILTDCIISAKELTVANDIKRVGYLYHILAKLIASNQPKQLGSIPLNYPSETYAEHAVQYIELNYNKISVSDIVEHIGINRSYLYRIFKKQFGISPQEYLIKYRLEKAAALLQETSDSIIVISHDIGYEDSLAFSKAFKKHYGMSPKHYRTQQ